MPTLPIYNSNQNIQANTAEPLRNEAAQPFHDQQKVIGTLQNIGEQWSRANDVMQETEAKAKHGIAIADIESRAYADPNFKNSDKYFKELSKAQTDSLSGIDNQQIASLLGVEFNYNTQIAKLKINHSFQKKQLEYNQVMVKTNLDNLMSNKLSAATPNESQQYDLQIQQLLSDNVKSGTLSFEEAGNLLNKSQYSSAENMVFANPEVAIDKLSKEDLGLDEKQKGKLIEEGHQLIEKRKKFADWQLQQTQTQSTIDLSNALSSNTLTPMMVRDMQQKGLIDSETAAIFDSISLKKSYAIPESTSLAEPDYFLRLLEDSAGDKTQIKKVMSDAAKAYGDHKIGTNQYLYFVQNAKETFDRQAKGIFTKSEGQNAFTSAIDGIKSFFTNVDKKSDKESKKAVAEFSDRMKTGDNPHVVKEKVLSDYRVNTKPQISNFPANGKLMVDKNGNKALVFPDGHVEEVK